jgi:hypothetical protein
VFVHITHAAPLTPQVEPFEAWHMFIASQHPWQLEASQPVEPPLLLHENHATAITAAAPRPSATFREGLFMDAEHYYCSAP